MKHYLLCFLVFLTIGSASAQVAENIPNLSSGVANILRYNNNLYIFGGFTRYGADTTLNGLAMLDAHTGALQNWNPVHDGYVQCMILQSGKLIVGGNFTTMAGQPRNGIAIFDAATGLLDPITVSQSYTYVFALWADSNTIYLTGTSGSGQFIQNFDLTTGIVSSWQSDQVFGEVFTMAKAGNYVYIGGQDITDITQSISYCLQRFDATTGHLDLAFMADSFIDINGNPGVWQILPYNNHIYACGEFQLFNNNSADGFLALDSNGNRTSFDIHADSYENYCMFPQGNYLWVGGNSYAFGGSTTYYAAQIDLSTGLATCWVNPDLDLLFIGSIYAQKDTVYLGYYWSIGSGNNAPSGMGGLEMAVGNVATGPVTATITHNIVSCGGNIDTLIAIPSDSNASVYYHWYGPYGIVGFGQTFVLNPLVTYDSIYVIVTNNLCDHSTYTSPWIQVGITNVVSTALSSTICQGSSYTFGGQNLTQSGTYYDTLTSVGGCDSIITLILSMSSPTDTLIETLCPGYSYNFHGQNLTTSGTYYDTLTSSYGCDSIITLILINSTPTIINQTVCPGNSYNFNGQSLTQTGIYYDTLISSLGCDSVIILTLTVPATNLSLIGSTCLGLADTLILSGLSSGTQIYWQLNDTIINDGYASGYTVAGIANGTSGDLANQLSGPFGVFVDASGNIFVADAYNNRIQEFPPGSTSGTNAVTVAGGNGQGIAANQLYTPVNIVLDGIGNLYIADVNNRRVQKFAPGSTSASNGVTVANGWVSGFNGMPQFAFPNNIGLDGTGNIYVLDQSDDLILQFSPGSDSATQGGSIQYNGDLTSSGFWVNSSANLYVGLDNYLAKLPFASNPIERSILGYNINGIYADANDNIYITDANSCSVLKFPSGSGSNSAGIVVAGGNGCGSGANQLSNPQGIFIDNTGSIYVADFNNNRIQKYEDATYDTAYVPTTYGSYNAVTIVDGCIVTSNAIVFNQFLHDTISETICQGYGDTLNGHIYTQPGTYIDTLTSIHGCDSIVVLILSVNPTSYVNIYDTICQGSSISIGSHLYSLAGIYSDTLSSIHGCDSIVTLTLTVTPASSTNFFDTICSNSSIYFGGHIFSQSGIYSATLTGVNGCDSIVVLNLTVSPIFSVNLYDTLVTGDTMYVGSNAYTQSGIYYDTLSSTHGCDSIVNLYLFVAPASTFANLFDTICQGFSVVVANHTYTVSGTYVDTLTGTYGGDSIVTLNLVINQALLNNINDTIGQGGSVTIGTDTYTQSGTYVDTLMSAAGCDSIVALHLVVATGISQLSSISSVNIYPNPTQGNFDMDITTTDISNKTAQISVTDMMGQAILTIPVTLHAGENKEVISLSESAASGIYIVQLTIDGQSLYYRLVLDK